MVMEKVTWRGTPGVGDFMWALNCVHLHAHTQKIKVNLEMHWERGPDHLHHFEDPETIIERMDYIHSLYAKKDDVEVSHVFYSGDRYTDWKYDDDVVVENSIKRIMHPKERGEDTSDWKARFWFENGRWSDGKGDKSPDNDWLFRKEAFRDTVRNKVVVWTPLFNAEKPRGWKTKLTKLDWDVIIQKLRRAGLDVVELCYRTPVREVVYHISTCRLVLCYDGMWHYVAKNFAKPLAVISKEGVTKYHTDHAIRINPDHSPEQIKQFGNDIWWWLNRPKELLGHSKYKAVKYENEMRSIIK